MKHSNLKFGQLIEENKVSLEMPNPTYINLPDGRQLQIRIWEPRLAYDDVSTVKIEAILLKPDSTIRLPEKAISDPIKVAAEASKRIEEYEEHKKRMKGIL